MNKKSRIFIAGHKGLVGSAVHRNLIKEGYKNLFVISKKRLDLKNTEAVNIFFRKNKIEYLIICAALAGGIVANKLYPTNEAYALAKISGIHLCKALYTQYNLDVVALMPTNLYGINDRYDAIQSHVIPAMIMKFIDAKSNNRKTVEIWGDGTPEREFLYSDDLAKAIHIILNKSKKKLFKLCNNTFPLINIGSGDIYTIKKLAELIQNKIGYKGKILFNKKYPNGVMKKNLKFDKIRKLNWKPSIKLPEGLDLVLNSIKY